MFEIFEYFEHSTYSKISNIQNIRVFRIFTGEAGLSSGRCHARPPVRGGAWQRTFRAAGGLALSRTETGFAGSQHNRISKRFRIGPELWALAHMRPGPYGP